MSRSDWSADVWSSDLAEPEGELEEVVIAELLEGLMATDAAEEDELVLGIIDDVGIVRHVDRFEDEAGFLVAVEAHEAFHAGRSELQIGRASLREGVCQYVEMRVVAGYLRTKKQNQEQTNTSK